MGLSIQTLGELTVKRDSEALPLPASKKTRALLAYLVLTGRPHRRDRLCEVLWELPDDPRAALRWSLTKLRPLVNDDAGERLVADRERVGLQTAGVDIDLRVLEARLQREPGVDGHGVDGPDFEEPGFEELVAMAEQLAEPLLDGLDLPNQELFQHWLVAEREETANLRVRVLERLARLPSLTADRALKWSRSWLEADPFNPHAGAHLIAQLKQVSRDAEAEALARELTDRFRHAGTEWPPRPRAASSSDPRAARAAPPVRQLLAQQKIQFCTTADDVRIAYASVGEGRPLVKAANWLSHLELDWDAPIWSPLFRELARDHHFVRYDERGNGLSDWDVDEISFDVFVTDLETVTDALGLERFALLGISQGASVSIEYAVRYPERVSHLILFGAYAAGWRINATPEVTKEREAVIALTETGWGQDNPAYRQIFSSTFMPSATIEELNWFNEFQRRTTSPENAARFLSAFGDIDVRHQLAKVTVPTLVIHSLRDRRIPVGTGRDIAAAIPHAEFLGLESDGHLLLGREQASQVFVEAVRQFLMGPRR
jgi:pimeloyl-ACP methyl ester carboxylesterase/DNA-binding SARP family transcriptional activator